MTDEDKAALIFATRLADPKRPALTARQWNSLRVRLADEGRQASDLLHDPGSFGRDSEETTRYEQLASQGAAVMAEVDALQSRGVWLMVQGAEGWPDALEALGEHQPSVLFGVGDWSLLENGGVGIVGSRDVSPEGAEVARAFASKAVAMGTPVVSGAARGVDQLAMNSAYQDGGRVVGVLADSLLQRIRSADMLAALDSGSTCLISIRSPSAGFSAGAAMARNKIIYALASFTVVVASATDSGGTWQGATEAIKHGYGTVFVWRGVGEGPGNVGLERLGAIPIRRVHMLESVGPDSSQFSQLTLLD